MFHKSTPALAAVLFLAFSAVSQAQPICGARTLVGTYEVSYDGLLIVTDPQSGQPMPLASVLLGVLTIDYSGHLSGTATASNGGQIIDIEYSGSVEVTDDCTGIAHWHLKPKGAPGFLPGEGAEKLVIDDAGESVTTILTQGVLGSPVSLGHWKRLSRFVRPADF